MKNKVFMSSKNGHLIVGIPLFKRLESTEVDNFSGYSISLTAQEDKPVAYILDFADNEDAFLASAKWVEDKLINLGDF